MEKHSYQQKFKALTRLVYRSLNNGDYTTLDILLQIHSARDISKFLKGEVKALLNLTLSNFTLSPNSLKYLVANVPNCFIISALKKRNYCFLMSFTKVFIRLREGNEREKLLSEIMLEKFKILYTTGDIEVKEYIKQKLPDIIFI
jgi:hypothetical protein